MICAWHGRRGVSKYVEAWLGKFGRQGEVRWGSVSRGKDWYGRHGEVL